MIFTIASISKRYSDNTMLENISAEIEGGKVYGLIGYNGGGKSTLAKIICGVIEPDEGRLLIDGKECSNWNIRTAMKEGVFLVDNDRTMLPNLSLEENILLGINFIKRNPLLGTFTHRIIFRKKYKALLKHYGIKLDTGVTSIRISHALKSIMELIRVQVCNPKLVVIDEIDTNVDEASLRIIYKIIRDMADSGVGIMYISHDLERIMKYADVVSIIVDTQLLSTMDSSSVDAKGVVDTLIRISKEKPPRILVEPEAKILELKHMNNQLIKDFNVEVREGEIVGIIGLNKEGDDSFSNILFKSKGEKSFRNRDVRITMPQEAIDTGIVLLDSNLLQNYIFSNSTISDNMIPYKIRAKHLSDAVQNEMCKRYLTKIAINAEPDDKIEMLSMGEQKKVLIMKSILSEGDVYVFDRLMDNIDVVSKVDIYNIINELKRKGKGLILISNDYKEIAGISDIVYVIKEGKVAHKVHNNKQGEKELLDIYLSQ
jgi:ribose transport system ATP-binding protein